MTKTELIRKMIAQNIGFLNMQTFNCGNCVGDTMITILNENGVTIKWCPDWGYLEIFGLSDKEYQSLSDVLEIC